MKKCTLCQGNLFSWSKFRDMEMKDDVFSAAIGSIVNCLGHMFWGNSRYRGESDHWSQELYFCKNCRIYYMKCPRCGNLMPLGVMPQNGQTLVVCKKCGDRTLYAGDYDMGGG